MSRAHEIAEDLRFHATIGREFAKQGVPRPIPDYVWAEALAELLDPPIDDPTPECDCRICLERRAHSRHR